MTAPGHPPSTGHRSAAPRQRPAPRWVWPGYATAAVALAFAAVSFYWGAGGMAGASTLGGPIEDLARARDPMLVTVVWISAFAKLAGAALALALVQRWGQRLPRRWLRAAAWSGAVALTLYGAAQVVSVALVATGIITPTTPVEPMVLRWRLLVWEPWFLVWGLLLALTTWTTRPRRAKR